MGATTPRGAGDRRVSVVITVRNDAAGARQVVDSLAAQTRRPEELIVVDGGSTDDTVAALRELAEKIPWMRVIEARGANIAAGRNVGTRAATGEIIATTDAGCRAAGDWLEKLVRPFELDPRVDVVAGFYDIEAPGLLERVVGMATMRGQLEPVNPRTFNPSGRSMAYTRSLWSRAGGWPEWVDFSEDTLFDHKIRRLNVEWRFVSEAVVHWRPRSSVRAIARQFYHYGTGRGHTQIGAADFVYNLRNVLLVGGAGLLALIHSLWLIPCTGMWIYFYVWTFHPKASRIRRRTATWKAYPLCVFVMWVVLFSHLWGYLVGSWQRWKDPEHYRVRQRAYLEAA